jgi:3-dehydro-L-gulonate 2-dehydrogenase
VAVFSLLLKLQFQNNKMKIAFNQLFQTFKSVLVNLGFADAKASRCARIFAENSRDGVYSHGLNRFPTFVQMVKEKHIDIYAEPEKTGEHGVISFWQGNLAPGMYTATLAMQEAITTAKQSGIGCVAVKSSNHWMRGGSYGWQAADAGCIAICSSNTIANMPPWGGVDPRLGNNPLVIAVPRKEGHIVLDMAMSQFSYGKMQEYELKGAPLPVAGGYDEEGNLSTSPSTIKATQRPLPIGFWKGSGLSFILDVLISALSGGKSVGDVTAAGTEKGLSQLFLAIDAQTLHSSIIEDIINYTKSSQPMEPGTEIYYPGEKTLLTRIRNEKEGIPVNEKIWNEVLEMARCR